MTNRFYCGVFHRFSRDVKFLSIKPGIASSHCNYSPKLAILQNTVSVKLLMSLFSIFKKITIEDVDY